MTRNAAVVSAATLLSRLLGFIRDCTIAAVLGAGPMADALVIAMRLPNLMRRLFGEGSLSLALIGEFSHTRSTEGLPRAYAMARACALWLTIILCVVCAAAMAWSEPLTLLLAPGFHDSPELFARTAQLVRLCFPYALLICMTALCSAILQARQHFLAPALAPCIMNLCLIAGAGAAYCFGWAVPESIGAGLLLAGVLQIALQQPFLHRQGFLWRGPCSLRDAGAQRVGKLMLPSLFGAAVYQLSIVLTTMLASLLPEGSIAQLYYADRLVQFPLGVFGIAVGTAALPALATLAAEGAEDAFRTTLSTALRLTLFISLPAAAGLAGLAGPLIDTLFGRGAFTSADVAGTVHALWGYAPGLPAFAAARPLLAAFHARRDARTPVTAAVVGLLVTLGSGLALMGPLKHAGLALAVSLGSWTNVAVLYALAIRRNGPFFRDVRWALCYAGLSLLVLGLSRLAATWGTTLWALAGIPVIIVLYMFAAIVIRSPDILLLTGRARK